MARKSTRLSSASQRTPTHKRAASATTLDSGTAKKTKKATPTKSQYFDQKDPETGADDSLEAEDEGEDEDATSEPGDDASDFASETASDDEDEESYDDDEEAPKRGKKSTPRKTGAKASGARGSEVWREGVKTGLGPGKEVIIKKPKARPAGKTPYTDDTLHPNTLLFLSDLKKNNDREWLKSE